MNEKTIYFLWDCLQYLINGISLGSIYALIALGYTMVYGIIRFVNFAHGEFLMLGAMAGFYCISWGAPMYLSIVFAVLSAAILAVLVERFLYRPIRGSGRIPALITAIGASLFFQYFGQIIFGAEVKVIKPFMEEKYFNWGEISVSNIQIAIFVITLGVLAFLWWLAHYTKIGKAMRATSFNLQAAELMGINTNMIISFTFFLGAGLAGLAGMLLSYTVNVEPTMGTNLGLKAFISAVVGGIGYMPGAALGGIVLGVAENLVTGFSSSTYRDGVAFLILILILMIKPAGLLGKNKKEKV